MLGGRVHGIYYLDNCEYMKFIQTHVNVKFEVLMVEAMKIIVLWDVRLCSMMDKYQHFGGTCHLLLYGSVNFMEDT